MHHGPHTPPHATAISPYNIRLDKAVTRRNSLWYWDRGTKVVPGNRTSLIVDTTNFNEHTNFRGSAENLLLIERFTRVDADTIDYEFTIDDLTTFTRPWTAARSLSKLDGLLYEYACHEGNDGLADILSINRAVEKAEAAKKGVDVR